MTLFSKKYTIPCILLLSLMATACVKDFLPTDRLTVGSDSRFTYSVYEPVLGRNTLMSDNFYVGSSSQPLDFKIVNMRRKNGEPAPELTEKFPVQVWTDGYTGKEASLEEIQAKRTTEYRPLFEIREHSGEFMMWSAAKSSFIHAIPDSGYVFDVEVSNSGGRRYFKGLHLKPFRERPYEPSNLNPVTGSAQYEYLSPNRVFMRGVETASYLFSGDVRVMFHKVGNGNSLKFRFLDTLMNPIDPNKFELTKWDKLVHGFDMEKTDEYVRYQVAYPIPLIEYPTAYTTPDGSLAHVEFAFSREGTAGSEETNLLHFNFAIHEKGDWEIVFWFYDENPKFEDD